MVHMPTVPATSSIPLFERFIQDRKYLKNVSPRTVYHEEWKAFQPFVEPVIEKVMRLLCPLSNSRIRGLN